MRASSFFGAIICAVLVMAMADVALACPYCAGQDKGGSAALYVIGGMMLLPWVVVAVAIPLIRRVGARATTFGPETSLGGNS